MDPKDARILTDMKTLALTFEGQFGLADVSAQLATWRNNLAFRDYDWEREITEHIVTLDSASTFVPGNDQERTQYLNAIKTAIAAIITLVDQKIGES
jgi:hypothetical protein